MKLDSRTIKIGTALICILSIISTLVQFWPASRAAIKIKLYLLPPLLILLTVGLLVRMMSSVYARVVHLFSNEEVWNGVLRMSGAVWMLGIMTVPMIYAAGLALDFYPLCYLSLLLSIAGFIILQIRKARASTLMIPGKKEKEIKAIVRGSLRAGTLEGGVEDKKMRAVYRRVCIFMEEEKPYLDNEVDLAFFSQKLFTNKVYLSRAINVFSGRNFRQFLNHYRVEYSIELMKKDPHLTVEEVANMSGFSTSVSYNMAFRMFKNSTPREWLDRYRESLRP